MLVKEDLLESLLSTVQDDAHIRMVVLTEEQILAEYPEGTAYALHIAFVAQHVEQLQQDAMWQQQLSAQLTAHMPKNLMLFPPTAPHYSYLLLFDDGNRISVKLLSKDEIEQLFQLEEHDMHILADKDKIASQVSQHILEPPTAEAFNECCSTFWWGTTNVVKSMLKQEQIAAAEHFHTLVRKSLLQMLAWYVASEHQFTITIGKYYKQLPQYLSDERYRMLLNTYNIGTEEQLDDALQRVQTLFREATMAVGMHCHFSYPPYDAQVSQLLQTLKK